MLPHSICRVFYLISFFMKLYTIKPMEWQYVNDSLVAQTGIGEYWLVILLDKRYLAIMEVGEKTIVKKPFHSIKEAKEFCEKDYETRLMECLNEATEAVDKKIEL